MLVAVTCRPLLSAALTKASVSAAYAGGTTVPLMWVPRLADALHPAMGASLLVLDLEFCADEPELFEQLAAWKAQCPAREIIAIDTLTHTTKTGEFFWHMGKLCTGAPVSYTEAADPNFWVEVYLKFPFSRAMVQVQLAFDSALDVLAEKRKWGIPNIAVIKQQLALAPQLSRVDEMAEEFEVGELEHSTKRYNLQSLFKKAGQATPKDFISAFRLMIHNYLRERHAEDKRTWRPAQIAQALGQTPREMRRTFSRRAGIPFATLARIAFPDVLQVAIALTIPCQTRPSYRALIQDRAMLHDPGGSRKPLLLTTT